MDKQDLKNAGLKVTLPRVKIFQILEQAKPHHKSAEEVYTALLTAGEDVGLATVYRVLTQFEAAGLVKRHHFAGDRSVYEIDQGVHHDHLVCIKCNTVEEFIDDAIEQRQIAVAERTGFIMTDHSLTIYGICKQCNA